MSSESLVTSKDEENQIPVIDINNNIGESNDGELMPKKKPDITLEEKVIPAENQNPELNVEENLAVKGADDILTEQIDNSANESLATAKTIASDNTVDQNDIIEIPDDAMLPKATKVELTPEMQKVIELYSTFENDIGPYVTIDQAKEVVKNNYNDETIAKVISEIETRKEKDLKSFANDGRDFKLVNDGLKELRIALVDEGRADLAEKLNLKNTKETFAQLEDGDNKVSSKLVYKLAGINPDLDGVDGKTRTIMSFAHYDDKTIATQAHDAIVANLPKNLQKEYRSMNYTGDKVHVQNYEFDDGKRRLIYKVPESLGGDNKYRLFNKPGLEIKDVQGFTGEIGVMSAEIVAAIAATKGGPNAVALSSAASGGIAEMIKLYTGQKLGVNLDLTDEDIVKLALKRGMITGVATRALIPVFNTAAKMIKNGLVKAPFVSELTGEVGTLPSKIRNDFVKNFKSGLSNEEKVAEVNMFKEALKERAGLSEKEAAILVKETIEMMNPTSATGSIASQSKKTLDADPKFVSQEGKEALVLDEKQYLEFQNKFFKEKFGIDITKINTTTTNTEIMKDIINVSKYYSQADQLALIKNIKQANEAWTKLTKNKLNKVELEQENFNSIIVDMVGELKTTNMATAYKVMGQEAELMKNVFVKFPARGTVKSDTIPRFLNTQIKDLNKQLKLLKQNKDQTQTSKSLIDTVQSSVNDLKLLEAQFKNTKSMEYSKVQALFNNLEGMKGANPAIDKTINMVMFKLRQLKTQAADQVPAYAKLMEDNTLFFKQKSLIQDGVLNSLINKLGGTTTGVVSKAKAQVGEDFFLKIFGNSKEQLAAADYLGTLVKKNSGQLSKTKIDEIKTLVLNRFISDVDGGMPVNQWMSKHGKAVEKFLDKDTLKSLTKLTSAKEAVEEIALNEAKLMTEAKKFFPKIFPKANLTVDDLNAYTISEQIVNNPNITPKAFAEFYKKIGTKNQEQLKAQLLNNLFSNNRSISPLTGKNNFDATKVFNWINNTKNEQIFENMMGTQSLKSFKTITAAMSFMQNIDNIMLNGGKALTNAEAEQVRQVATRMIYGPLSHENVIFKGALFFLNKLDGKLGAEIADYDLFLKKFANSYAFKWAPTLNDKKFLKYFNTYESGAWQRFGVGSEVAVSGAGVDQSLKGAFNEDTGLPTFPVVEYLAKLPFQVTGTGISFSYDKLQEAMKEGDGLSKREKIKVKEIESFQ